MTFSEKCDRDDKNDDKRSLVENARQNYAEMSKPSHERSRLRRGRFIVPDRSPL